MGAQSQSVAVFLPFAGSLVTLLCGFRLFIRVYKRMEAWGRAPNIDPFFVRRLKDTVVLEVFGCIAGMITVTIASQFLK